jgi:UDP-glucose 4-epimerase
MKNKLILIIGGAGYIGSHLCNALSKNNDVYSLDNYSNGYISNHIKDVTYINGDSRDIDKLINFRPDIIFHLGEYSRVEQSFNDIDLVWQNNILCIFPVVSFASKNKSKLIYAGSSTKFSEKEGLGRTLSPYAWSKAVNTEFIVNFSKWYNLDYAITYFYNVYGGREIKKGKYATLIGIFQYQYLNGLPLTIVKPGNQKRNFTHIEDIISGLLLVAEKGWGDNYGIGNDEMYSIIEVAKMFNHRYIFIPERKGNRIFSKINTSKTKSLGWNPKYKLNEYIREFVETHHNTV